MDAMQDTFTMLHLEPGAVIADRYVVQSRLGAGGVGMVFRVIDQELNNEVVALKLLHPHLAQEEKVFARFRNEVLVARTLTHPNIVRIHDIGKTSSGFPYISMEYVDGYTLSDRIAGKARAKGVVSDPIHFREAVNILYHIAAGIGYAHEKGVIHRDLKPANVMMTKRAEVKLADFGMARILGAQTSLTQTGQALGTPDYMAPEQITGQDVDERCDIYALGIIGYELVVGKRPFVAESSVALAFKHLNEPIPDFATSEIPMWYQDLVKKAAGKTKEERFPSAYEFAKTLALNLPEIVSQTGLFSIDKTGLYQAAASHNKKEHKFELGETKDTKASDTWEFGLSDSSGSTITQSQTPGTTRIERKSFASVLGGMLAIIATTLLVLPRVVPSFQKIYKQKIEAVELAYGKDLSMVSKMFGVDAFVSEEKKAVMAGTNSIVEPSGKTREALEQELLAGSNEEKKNVEVATSEIKEADKVVTPQITPPSVEEIQTSEVKASGDKGELPKEILSSVDIKKEEKPIPTTLPDTLSISLNLFRGAETKTASNFEFRELKNVRWIALIEGDLKIDQTVLKRELIEQFALNVYDPQTQKVIIKIKPEVISLPSENETQAKIGSTLSLLPSELNAGTYRLDLLRNSEVLKSQDVSFYRAEVKVGPPLQASKDKTEERIEIVKLPSSSEMPPQLPPQNVIDAIPTRRMDLNPEVKSDELPPAKKPYDELRPNNQSEETKPPSALLPSLSSNEVAPTIEEPPLPQLPHLTYSGALEDPSGGKKSLVLEIQIIQTSISGTATIDQYGKFDVTGTVHPRGLEMVLRNEQYALSLVSSRREGELLKGQFTVPAENKRGPWQARLLK